MKIFSDKQLTMQEVWTNSFRLYFKTLPHVWQQSAIIAIIGMLVSLLGAQLPCQEVDLNNITLANIGCGFTYAIFLLSAMYFTGLLLHRIYVLGDEQNVSLRDSIVFVGKRFFMIAGGSLLVLLLCLLGLFALVLPGFFLLILFFMVQPLILLDDKGCFSAIKGSSKLVWGNWWRTFAIATPLLFFSFLMGLSAQYISTNFVWWYGVVSVALVSTFFYPLLYACILIQFGDLKLRYHTRLQVSNL